MPLVRARAAAGAIDGRAVVLIDGRSGSGKTTLGRMLAASLGAQLVSLDDIYPGWDGLAAGSVAVARDVLDPAEPGWRGWDWAAERPGGWHPLDPNRSIVVEGCGAISPASRARATLAVWIDRRAAERRRRALARDGDAYAPHWSRWAAQEREHLASARPRALADVVLGSLRQAQPRRCNSASSMP